MKNLYAYLLFFFLLLSNVSNAQSWEWARAGLVPDGCSVASENWANATDKWGNVYMAGSVVCTQITFGTTLLSNVNTTRMTFVVKYDSTGNVLWAKKGDPMCTINETQSIAVDTLGNVYVGGYIGCPMAIGSLQATNPNNDTRFFLVKFDQNGNEQWVKTASYDAADNNIAVDNAGNVIIAGSFHWSLTLESYSFPSLGSEDLFIAKYNTAGTLLWVKTYASNGSERIHDAACDGSGNILITGDFLNSTAAASLSFGTSVVTAPINQPRNFTAKLDANGDAVWAKQSEYSGGNDIMNSMVLDPQGNIYITGSLFDSIKYGGLTLHNYPYVSQQGKFNFHVVKYNSSGVPQWLKRGGSSEGTERAEDITLDAAGNVWLSGKIGSYPMGIDNYTVSPVGTDGYNSWIGRLDPSNGNATYLMQVKLASGGQTGIVGDRFGNVYFCGAHKNTTTTIAGTPIASVSRNEPFMAKLCTDCPLSTSVLDFTTAINMYPNPATDKIVIEGGNDAKEVSVFNMLGQRLIHQSFDTKNAVLNIEALPSGAYVVVVSDSPVGGKVTKTIVKQ